MRGCILEDSPTRRDLQDTFGEIDTEKFDVPCCRGINSNLWLQDEHGRVSWPSDDSPKVDPGWPRRRLGSGASEGEAVGYLVRSGLVLLRVRGWLLLESALPVTLEVNGGASILSHRPRG